MNVIFEVNYKEYVVNLREAKRILNEIYKCTNSITINGEEVSVDRAERMLIMKQLHGEIYV